jgi:hypoxanthine phosphoribosyltransferase
MTEHELKVLYPEEQIKRRVDELALTISEDYRDADELILIGVLRGCYMFMADLSRCLTVPRRVDFIAVSSYEHDTTPGACRLVMDTRIDIEGKHVLIIDDIYDTGNTLTYLTELFHARHPASIRRCVLLRKQSRMEKEVKIDYLGFDIPDVWVVGYGLDFADRHRALPFIGYITQ